MKIIIIIFLNLLLINAYASCLNRLRIISNINGQVEHPLMGGNNTYKDKADEFREKVRPIESMELIFKLKRGNRDKSLLRAIEVGFAGELTETLKIVRKSINDPTLVLEWVENLHRDIVQQIYFENKTQEINLYEEQGTILESTFLELILERSMEGGFSGKANSIITFIETMSIKDFANTLIQKKLIQDEFFRDKEHGHLTHMMHVDFMIYALKKHGLDPLNAGKLYQWFGFRSNIEFKDLEMRFESLKTGWSVLFDSYQKDLTSPETLGPILKNYFKLR